MCVCVRVKLLDASEYLSKPLNVCSDNVKHWDFMQNLNAHMFEKYLSRFFFSFSSFHVCVMWFIVVIDCCRARYWYTVPFAVCYYWWWIAALFLLLRCSLCCRHRPCPLRLFDFASINISNMCQSIIIQFVNEFNETVLRIHKMKKYINGIRVYSCTFWEYI